MLFPEYAETIGHWRLGPPASGIRADKVWTPVGTVEGRWEPIKGSEAFLNSQNFANVSEYLFMPYSYRTVIKPGDGLVDEDGIQRRVVGQPEVWKYELPCVVALTERIQWTVTS